MKSEFYSRLLVGSFGIILTLIATFISFESTLFFLLAIWTFIFLELNLILALPELIKDAFFFFSLLLFILAYHLLLTTNFYAIYILAFSWILTVFLLCFKKVQSNRFFTFLYMIYFTIPFSFLVSIRKGNGSSFFFLLFLIVWTLDIFSYFFGMCFGKHLIVPKISPKKTWEGTIFGILFSFATGLFGFYYLLKNLSLFLIIACFLLPVIGFLGDIFESSIKRRVNKKDSGTFLLGHGGYLDRFDSLLFVSIFFGILLHYL